MRHDEDLREPLVRRQGRQVSMRMARGSKGQARAELRLSGTVSPFRARGRYVLSVGTMEGGS